MDFDPYMENETFKTMQKLRNNYILREMLPHERKMVLHKNWFNIGFKSNMDDVFVKCSEVWRAIVLGQTRSGKTMLLRRMMDLAHLNGWHVCWITDVKDEVKSSKRAQLRDFVRLLPENDIPQGIGVKVYRPNFFTVMKGGALPKDNDEFAISYSTLDFSEILTALDISGKDDTDIKNVLSEYWDKVSNFDELVKKVENGNYSKRIKNRIRIAAMPLIKYDVFPEIGNQDDFLMHMTTNPTAFNVRGFRKIGTKELMIMPQLYIKIIQRLIIEAREKNILKNRVLLIYDEAPAFLSDKMLTSEEIKGIVDREAYLGVYVIFAAQVYTSIPAWIYEQSEYIFFPSKFELKSLFAIMKHAQIYKWHTSEYKMIADQIREIKANSKSGHAIWGMIRKSKGKIRIFRAYPSISCHQKSQN